MSNLFRPETLFAPTRVTPVTIQRRASALPGSPQLESSAVLQPYPGHPSWNPAPCFTPTRVTRGAAKCRASGPLGSRELGVKSWKEPSRPACPCPRARSLPGRVRGEERAKQKIRTTKYTNHTKMEGEGKEGLFPQSKPKISDPLSCISCLSWLKKEITMKKLPAAARSVAHVAHVERASIRRAATAMLAPSAERDF